MPANVMELNVNGEKRRVEAAEGKTLLRVLREDLDLTGAKYGCGEGQCGACTVLLDGKPVRSCITPVSEAAGKRVTTVEGLEQGGKLHPLQQAFLDEGAMQCGYCTPGMILSAVALATENPEPTDEQVIQWMNRNLCRCCGYPRILKAIRAGLDEMRKAKME
jgi:aerobic-type carbon monoxide dehydrogenase small subunit (CoxS/CutS family)